MTSRKIRLQSLFAVFAFVPALTFVPAPARAGDAVVSLTVRSGETTHTFEQDAEATDAESFVLRTGAPQKPTQLVIPRTLIERASLEETADGTHWLLLDGEKTALRVRYGPAEGPGENEVTYTGTVEDTETAKEVEFEAVVDPVPAVVIVVGIGALMCLGVIAIEAYATDCENVCLSNCGEGQVSECVAKVTAGLSLDPVKVGCGKDCISTCKQGLPVSRPAEPEPPQRAAAGALCAGVRLIPG